MATQLSSEIDRIIPMCPGPFVGARPKTQCLDIAHGLATIVETSPDLKNHSANGQQDVKQYYDLKPILLIVLWLENKGFQPVLFAAALLVQMLPVIVLKVGTATCV